MQPSSIAVANFFIRKGLESGNPITPMQALKLAYVANGWYLGFTSASLFNDRVEAWQYGPVIPRLYHSLKGYGSGPIGCLIPDDQPWSGSVGVPQIQNPQVINFLEGIWQAYGGLTGIQLSALTHEKESPWDIVWNKLGGANRRSAEIPENVIRDYYSKRVKEQAAAAQTA